MSLTELLIAISVMAILAAMAVPGLRAALTGYELSTAGFEAAAKVGEARTNALKRNRQTWLLITSATGTLQVQMTDPATATTVNVGNPFILPRRVQVVGAATQLVRFDPMGRPVDGAGVLQQQTLQMQQSFSSATRTVTAGTTGRIWVN